MDRIYDDCVKMHDESKVKYEGDGQPVTSLQEQPVQQGQAPITMLNSSLPVPAAERAPSVEKMEGGESVPIILLNDFSDDESAQDPPTTTTPIDETQQTQVQGVQQDTPMPQRSSVEVRL